MKIENFQDALPGSSLVATFDLYVPEIQMTIHNCKVLRSKKGNLFPTLPNYMIASSDGTKKFLPVITFSLEKETEFKKSLNEAITPFITNH